ncbi:tRNA uridine-5-carboxymethylaminomethyl(34) synthesis GTPase MnmE [Inhella proteolytica]|uniref:tRNA modification GTPase MnmE n=1 Tax=Inhella proteolytica TaxID=2795029 RepID=A0A931J6H4_9BURK|nr:tRNA uridine-5-carboxymethylaminomethyl(34) synthesis GTPase MnmE [Inhella proteolytica]MBH9577207.1 tRNA uridine-5-carboxymethylaminomethyl(34) synthesis GTPase MnmE [Inhella proteolytica]
MLARHQDPIVAIATAPGRGAVGIVRVSARAPLEALIHALCGQALKPRHAHYLPLRAADGTVLDHGLALHFPAPHSYTGEQVLELQAHGGPVLLQLLLARCLEALPGARLAEPGEFTQRAFLNGKLDLAQAEAVADLIDASTETAARSAARALDGALSTEVNALRDALIHLRMFVEATLDFPEEEDVEFVEQENVLGQLGGLQQRLAQILARTRQGALLRDGLQVVLAGQPNVGKSSLLNALAGAELAIVTPIPGTTRDRVSEQIQIEGVPLHIVDTAGLREASDEVERIGVARSWESIARADVVLFLHDLTRLHEPEYQREDERIRAQLAAHDDAAHLEARLLHVYNKADAAAAPAGGLSLSAKSGAGLDALRRELLQRAGWQSVPEGLFIARERHVRALRATLEHVQQAEAQVRLPALDLVAEELRLAHEALSAITGQFTADDLLGEIFGRFCIGK